MVLSDANKRAAYDRGSGGYDDERGHHHSSFFDTGPHGGRSQNNRPHGGHRFTRSHAFDIFDAFFGGQDPFEAMHQQHAAMQQQMFGGLGFGGFGGGFGMMGGFGGGMFGSPPPPPPHHHHSMMMHHGQMHDPFAAFGMGGMGGGSQLHTAAQHSTVIEHPCDTI